MSFSAGWVRAQLIGSCVLACLAASPVAAAELQQPTALPSDGLNDGLRLRLENLIQAKPWILLRTPAGGGIYPTFGSFAEGASFAPGLTYWNPRFKGSRYDIYASASHSFSDDEMLELRFGRVPHAPGRPPSRNLLVERLTPYRFEEDHACGPYFFYAEARARQLRERHAYEADGTSRSFGLEDRSFELVAGYRLAPGLVGTLRTGWLSTRAGLARREATGDVVDLLRGELAVAFDRRDVADRPSRGAYLQATWGHYAQPDGAGLRFDRASFDARGYLPLGSPRDMLAVRGLVSADLGADAGRVPYFLQETLGGSRTLRGYESFRVRGPRLAAFDVEYRRELGRGLDAVAFYDAGAAFGAGAPEPGRWRSDVGLGLRLRLGGDGPLLRIDAARGSEGTRLQVKFGHAF
jgi:hypothetical protein